MGWKKAARAGLALAALMALISCGGGGSDPVVSGGGGSGGTGSGGTGGTGGGTPGGGTGGGVPGGDSGVARPSVAAGYFGLNSEGESGDGDGGGDGGGGDGGGDGGIGAGGSLGAFTDVSFKVTDEDGELIGQVDVPSASAVTIYPPLDYSGLLNIEIIGSATSTYFDESLDANAPTGSGVIVRAVVSSAADKVGVTPFTSAAASFLEVEVAAGRASAFSIEDALAANQKTVEEINRFLPEINQIPDISIMPVLTNSTTDLTEQSDSISGRYAQALAAFAVAARAFNPQLQQPALAFTRNLERDMTDGRIDNRDKDGNAIAPDDELAYDAEKLAVAVQTALRQVSSPASSATGKEPSSAVCLQELVANDQVYSFDSLRIDNAEQASCLYDLGPTAGPGAVFVLEYVNEIDSDTDDSNCVESGEFVITEDDTGEALILISTARLVAVSFPGSVVDSEDGITVLRRAVAEGVGAQCPVS